MSCFICVFIYVNLTKYKCFFQKWPNCSLTAYTSGANFPTGFDISKKIMGARGYELTSEFCCNNTNWFTQKGNPLKFGFDLFLTNNDMELL